MAEAVRVDSVVTDPPYHLGPTVNRLQKSMIGGNTDIERRAASRGDAIGRLSAGFMGQQWDGGDIAFRPETWATIGEILKPGGFLLAFGGSRTHHRIWTAIESAGFVIQDTIMWLYGSGFPKHRAQLKPAHEPICVAYKPGGRRELQIDECRLPTKDNGRWPTNVCHDGSDEVMEAFAAFGDARGSGRVSTPRALPNDTVFEGIGFKWSAHPGFGDTGTAARFFYTAKASAEDRWGSRHPTVKPIALMKWLIALVTPKGGMCLDPFAGSGTTGVAALATGRNAILIEREVEYLADIEARLAHWRGEAGHSVVAKNRKQSEVRLPLFDIETAK